MHIWLERTLCIALITGYLLLAWSISFTAFVVCTATTICWTVTALIAAISEPPGTDS